MRNEKHRNFHIFFRKKLNFKRTFFNEKPKNIHEIYEILVIFQKGIVISHRSVIDNRGSTVKSEFFQRKK